MKTLEVIRQAAATLARAMEDFEKTTGTSLNEVSIGEHMGPRALGQSRRLESRRCVTLKISVDSYVQAQVRCPLGS